MRSNSIYRFVLFAFLLLCMGCEEHISKEVTPSLNPRHLSVNKVKIAAPSASAYSAKLSVSSINVPWHFNSYPSWLSLTPNQGETDTNVSANFTDNPSANISRYAIFFLEDNVEDWDYKQAITASQPPAIPYLQLSTNRIEVSGAACQHDVNVYTNASWRVNESSAWISTEVLDSSFQIKVQENNTGEFRESYITVSAADSTELIHLTQAPANATSTNDALSFSNQAASAKFSVTSETSWSATTSASWLQVTPENGTAGTTEVTVDVAPNVNIAERRGYITFKCNDVTELLTMEILQKGLYIEVDAEELLFEAQKSNQNLQINSNVEWIITFSPQWATPSISSNHGDASINITVEENLSTYERSGFLILESPGLSLSTKVQLTQKGKPFSLGTTELMFSDKASKNTVEIITDGTWIAQCDATWLTLSPHSASGNSTLTVSVSENLNDSERIAIVSVTMSDKTIELVIRQQGKYLSVGDAQLVFPTKGGFLNLQVATNDAWKASLKENAKWLNLSTSEGNESIDMIITATDNASVNERSEVLSITTKNNLKIELPIKQEARTLSVSASDVLFFARGGTSEVITIQTNGEFSMSQVGDWFAISRIGTNSFTVIAVKNNTKGNREGSITIALTDLTEGKYEVTIPVVQVQVGCSFTLSGFGEDSNQDNSFGDGNFSGNGFDVDLDWNASLGNAFSVGLISFVTDSNWDTIGNNTFTVTITEFQEDVNCDDKNDTSNTTLEKDNFGEENNWNE